MLAFDQEERLEVVLDEGVRYVSFSWGIDGELIGRAREHGAVVLVQVGDVASAVEAAERGAEVVIAQGLEAGGHVQGRTPILELVREMRRVLELPIVAAGGIADVARARAALEAGADAVAAVPPSSSPMRLMCIRPTSTAYCKQPRRTPCLPQSSTSVGRMRPTA